MLLETTVKTVLYGIKSLMGSWNFHVVGGMSFCIFVKVIQLVNY